MLKKLLILLSVVTTLVIAAIVGGNSTQNAKVGGPASRMFSDNSGPDQLASGPRAQSLELKASRSGAVGAARVDLPQVAGSTDSGPANTVAGSTIPFRGNKVIKTATIEVRVPKGRFQSRFDQASALAEELGGFVTNSSIEGSSKRAASGTITIRIPSDRHATAMSRLKAMGKVTSENQNGQDVSKEFVDLEARLRHAKAQEAFYLKLMGESKSVSDLLQVQQQLTNLQLEIEQIQGQLEYLKDQTSYSTVSARIFEPGAAVTSPPRKLGLAWQQAMTGFQNVLGGLVIVLGYVAPFGALAGLGAIIWRISRRRTRPVPTA